MSHTWKSAWYRDHGVPEKDLRQERREARERKLQTTFFNGPLPFAPAVLVPRYPQERQ